MIKECILCFKFIVGSGFHCELCKEKLKCNICKKPKCTFGNNGLKSLIYCSKQSHNSNKCCRFQYCKNNYKLNENYKILQEHDENLISLNFHHKYVINWYDNYSDDYKLYIFYYNSFIKKLLFFDKFPIIEDYEKYEINNKNIMIHGNPFILENNKLINKNTYQKKFYDSIYLKYTTKTFDEIEIN